MAKHEVLATVEGIRDYMERRFLYLYTSDRYNGEDAGEYSILESILAQEVTEEEQAVGNFATSAVSGSGESSGSGRGGSPAVAGSPRILTGGAPSTESPESPMLPSTEVPKFSHAGYDGGVVVGFQGEWDKKKFSRLLSILEEVKELAGESVKEGLEGLPLNLEGTEVLVCPKGGFAGGSDSKGGVIYKYRFFCQGVEFMIHSNPCEHIQPVRVRYGAESVQGHRNRLFDVHFGFVIPFLETLGLSVSSDKLSRVDMQCLIDVPMEDFAYLLSASNGHVVTKLRKKAEYGSMKRVETIEIGSVSNVQFCFYDKGKE